MSSVPTMASAMPISPARTPFLAVRGWLSHFSDKMNRAAATRHEPVPSHELAAASNASAGASAVAANIDSALVTFRLPTKHFEHAIGDPETADDVRSCRNNPQRAEHGYERGMPTVGTFRHHLNARDNCDRGDGV